MIRHSKREIERALEKIDGSDTPASSDGAALEDRYPSDVVTFVRGVALDLMRICHRHPDRIVNAPDSEAVAVFLELVREQYGIVDDRDDAVRQTLEDAADAGEHWRPVDSFTMGPVAIATHLDLSTADGESLEALIDAGRGERAEQLLVRTVYDVLADRGGSLEVAA